MIRKHTQFIRPEVVSVPNQLGKARKFDNSLASLAQDLSIWSLHHFKVQERIEEIFQNLGSQLNDIQVRRFCEVSRTAHRTETSISVLPAEDEARVRHPVLVDMSFYKKGERNPLVFFEFWFDEGACIYRHTMVDVGSSKIASTQPNVNSRKHQLIALNPDDDGGGL